MPVPKLYDLPYAALEQELERAGMKRVHARGIWRSLYRQPGSNEDQDAIAPRALARWLATEQRELPLTPAHLPVVMDTRSRDGLTRKLLLQLADGQTIETVIMGYPGRYTACISTQVGCAMGCVFCATGQMGFTRNLLPHEIVRQVVKAQALLSEENETLRNLVLMGMGEPLHNYEHVMTALDIISDQRGINVAASRISISTVGLVPGILRMAAENRPYPLAVSLHGATEETRGALLPISRRWSLAELIAACRVYATKTGRRIFFAWTMVEGVNDTPEHAQQIAKLLHGIDAHVNLIPLNPTDGYAGRTSTGGATPLFQAVLAHAGIPSTVRQRRGIDVNAGCGQLRAKEKELNLSTSPR